MNRIGRLPFSGIQEEPASSLENPLYLAHTGFVSEDLLEGKLSVALDAREFLLTKLSSCDFL